jgi:tetratricopeptide (TPR) repeat protein
MAPLKRAVQLMPDSATARVSLAYALFYTGALDDAQRETHEALRLDPHSRYAHGFLAWCLASPQSINRTQEELDQAIAHAKRAVELSGEGFLPLIESHTGLGVAFYRNGQLSDAATHLTKVIELENGATEKTPTGEWDKSICSFFLAMTRWQQGQQDEARRWYDDAAAWLQDKKPNDAELLRFRAEAAELLGIALTNPAAGRIEEKETPRIDQQDESATDAQRRK